MRQTLLRQSLLVSKAAASECAVRKGGKMTRTVIEAREADRGYSDQREYRCRYCKGLGVDRFGIMSPLSTCPACGGRTKFRFSAWVKDCAYCSGSGITPRSGRNPCLACRGRGIVTVPPGSVRCRTCLGTGRTENGVWYCFDCHGSGITADGAGQRAD